MIKLEGFFLGVFLLCSFSLWGQHSGEFLCEEETERLLNLDVMNQPDSSILVIEKLMPVFFAAKCWESYVDAHNFLSIAYYYKRDYQRAKENAQLAVEVSIKYLGKELMYAAAIANLSVFVDGRKSITLQEESLAIERTHGSDAEALAYALEGLGLSYQENGDYDTAIDYFKQAIESIKIDESAYSHEESRLLRQIASCYQSKNDFQSVVPNLKQSIAILDQLPDEKYYQQTRWYAYKDLAEAYRWSGDTQKAKKYIEKAIQMHHENELLEQYKSWVTYGDIYWKEGNDAQALKCYERAKSDAEEEFDSYQYHVALAKPLAAMAKVYSHQEKYPLALAFYGEALEFLAIDFHANAVTQNPSSDILINEFAALQILIEKAATLSRFYQSTQEEHLLEAAHETHLLVAEIVHAIRLGYLAAGSKHTLVEKTNSFYLAAITNALALHRSKKEQSYLSAAFMFAESNKAVQLYESIKDESARNSVRASDSLLQQERNLRAELTFYETGILEERQKKKSSNQDLIQKLEKRRFQLKNEIQTCIQLLEKQNPLYHSLKKQTEPIALAELQKKMPHSKTAIVEFVLAEENGYAFFLSKEQSFVLPIVGKQNLRGDLKEMSRLIASPSKTTAAFKTDFALFHHLSSSLYKKLLAEGLSLLPDEVDQLIIIPDDLLNYLPFDLLTTNAKVDKATPYFYKDLDYLFADYKISYHYSASMTTVERNPINKAIREPKFLGFAPSFETTEIAKARTCQEGKLFDLFCNEKEVLGISEILAGKTYLDEAANSTAFIEEAPNYQILHLATHACVQEEETDLNKIFFSKEEYLTQKQLSNMNLQAELTVLSACNTGAGKWQQGEGVMSLARCFLMAGSESVLTSLWSVDDCATSTIMLDYYKNLGQGFSKDQALAKAKENYLYEADLNESHPYYWAAFVQFGNIAPLSFSRHNSRYYWWGLLGFLFIGFLALRQKISA